MSLREQLSDSWYEMLRDEIKKKYFRKIPAILKKERNKYNIFPKSEDVFKAYRLTPFTDVRVVILGQDPYYNKHEANGLAFSVDESVGKTPPSLRNIFNEIERDLGFMNLEWSTDLTPWAKQGVFLLNRTLTVREGQPGSHEDIGWKRFTKHTIKQLNKSPVPIVFMLWGADARLASRHIDREHHLVLNASHPSPRSAYISFNGCGHFSRCNNFLEQHNLNPINWKITL